MTTRRNLQIGQCADCGAAMETFDNYCDNCQVVRDDRKQDADEYRAWCQDLRNAHEREY